MSETIRLERFCFLVTLKCNLKCRLCAERSPYYEKPYHPEFYQLTEQIDAAFSLIDHVGKFDITGGEPFLRKDLPRIIRHIFDNHRHRVDTLRIVSNGTLMPPRGIVEAAAPWGGNFRAILDNYPISTKAATVAAMLGDAGIPVEIRDYSDDFHCDGWVDYGDLSRKHSEEEARRLFEKCMIPKLGFFTCMVGGMIFPCAKARLLWENLKAGVCMGASDQLLTESGRRERLKVLLGDEVVLACRYCNGLCEDSRRFAPAEQMSAEEMTGASQSKKEDVPPLMICTQTYNNEKTIGRTVESVIKQTRRDFLYVVVNNGSTDKTGEIIEEYARRDPRIIHATTERNDILGILKYPKSMICRIEKNRFALGEKYYCIVDGDDALHPGFAENVLRIAEEHSPDMILPGYRRINASTGETINVRAPETDMVISGEQKAEQFYHLRALLLGQWGNVYKWKSLAKPNYLYVDNSSFGGVSLWHHELDSVGVLSRFYFAETAVFIGKPLYDFFIHPQSTVKHYYPLRWLGDVQMFHTYIAFLSKFGTISDFNIDYCHAIYLSLIEHTVKVILEAPAVRRDQKLQDILDILLLDETRAMLARAADPVFRNLARRGDFISLIADFMAERTEASGDSAELTRGIMAELARYDYHTANLEGKL